MIKYSLSCIVMLFLMIYSFPINAQSTIDSLKQILISRNGSEKVQDLIALGEHHESASNYPEALS